MAGKSILIAGILLSLFVLNNNAIAVELPTIADWRGTAGNGDWWNPANWDLCGSIPACPGVPNENIYANIGPSINCPNVTGDPCCAGLFVYWFSWDYAPDSVEMRISETTGLFNCGNIITISENTLWPDHGIINMYGGTVYTPGASSGQGGLEIGNESQSYGILNIYGGLMTVPRIVIYHGTTNLYGGTLEGTSSASSDLIISESHSMNKINVAGGTLRLAGDRTDEIYASRRIVPYEERGYLVVDYNVSTHGYTTVTAVYDLGVAFNPNPAHSQSEVSLAPILTWSPGDYVNDVDGHQVYFGTSFADVNDANVDNPLGVYKGVCDVNNYVPVGLLEPNTTYYWRIDEVNDANMNSPWKGNIWCFITTVIDWRIAQNPDPAYDQRKVSLTPILTWTPGYYVNDVNGHQVYFGTSFADVNEANINNPLGVYKGAQDINNYVPDGPLDINTIYYWRIDEVNNANADSPWKGNVWQFTTTPCPYGGTIFTGNLNDDCIVDLYDMKVMSQEWLTAGVLADLYPDIPDGKVDFRDFAILANNWLVEEY